MESEIVITVITQQVRSSGNASELCSGGVRFKSLPGHRPHSPIIFVAFLGPSGQIPGFGLRLGKARFLPDASKFLYRTTGRSELRY